MLIAAVLPIFLLTATLRAQSTNVNAVAKKAAAFLSGRLPKPFPGVESFTYSAETFPDGGLGCPEKGKTYPATATPGYRFLLSVQGVLYEVHTNLDGSAAVLCDAATVKQNPALSVYRSAQFSIAYPQAWTVTPRDAANSETYFGLTAAPVCTQPGLIVTLLGVQPPGTPPDALLDAYQKANPLQTAIVARADIGTLGRTATYTGACTDGTLRRTQVSVFIAFSKSYRVVTFAPQAAFNQWADVFRALAESFSPATLGSGGGAAVHPPDHTPPTLIVHVFGGNVYMANVADVPGAPLTRDADTVHASRLYGRARIAPNGKRVAFIDQVGHRLYLAPIGKNGAASSPDIPLSALDFPPAWSPDGSEIAYVAAGSPLSVQALRADTGAVRTLGSLPLTTCPTVSNPDPAAALLDSSVGTVGNGRLLTWPSAGVVLVSRGCAAVGVDRLDLASGQVTPLADLTRVQLSPAKNALAGIAAGKLATFDLTANTLQTLPIDADQVGWNADATGLFYTTRTLKTPLALSAPPATLSAFTSADYGLTLHSYKLSTGMDTPLFTGTGYAIGALATSPDGTGLLFTLVQSDAALLDGITRKASADDLRRLMPASQLYWLPFAPGGSVTLLADSEQPVFGPLGALAVIGLPVAPRPNATNLPGE